MRTYIFRNGKLVNVIYPNKENSSIGDDYSSDNYVKKIHISFSEGEKYEIIINRYERNPIYRDECIEYYRNINNGIIKCEICDFVFADKYGCEFSGKIHIHHKNQLSLQKGSHEIDPTNDLIPVCPNCHSIIHSNIKRPYTCDEVKKFIENANHNST